MSGPAWEALALDEAGMDVRLEREASAAACARALCGSRAMGARVLAEGLLRMGARSVAPTEVLPAGSQLRLSFARQVPQAQAGEGLPRVVYRDEVLLAVDKPSALLTHGDGTGADSLTRRVEALLAREGSSADVQAVQRLDVDTTGLVLFSLARELQPLLDAQVAGHEMAKRYLVLVRGRWDTGAAWVELDGPIARDRHDARRMRVGVSGQPALTRVRTLGVRDGHSLLLVELATGRRHQIRVHLSHAGHAIVGDALYGGGRDAAGLMLHAWQETLVHPVWRTPLALRTAWPERFARRGWREPAGPVA